MCQASPSIYSHNDHLSPQNAPFSALVCGVQGSGKSHTLSIMLENVLICGNSSIGKLQKPLSALVLHFGDGGASDGQQCEAAYIGRLLLRRRGEAPRVTVYVSPSSTERLRASYKRISQEIIVQPLRFREDELDAKSFLSLMAVDGNSDSAPLYMQTVLVSALTKLSQ